MANILLISYDNGSHIPYFPMNLAYLAHSLKKHGHRIALWSQDIHHGREQALTAILDNNPFHVVGLGFCAGYYQYGKAKKISEAISNSKRRKELNYVLGGHGPAGAPNFFLAKMEADTCIVGDGEKAILEVCEDGKRGVVSGENCEKDDPPIPIYEDWARLIDIYKLIRFPTSSLTSFCFPILSSRGCKWNCSFCFRMREGFHERSIDSIIEEIKWLHKHFNITHFQFADELLMSSVKRTEEICTAISALPFKIAWDCNGRLNFAKSPLLTLMKTSGAQYVNYGIESLNQNILNSMGKGLTTQQIAAGVEATLTAGLSPGLNLLWGFPENRESDLQDAKEFLLKYDLCHELRTIRPVTPYPGCRLWKYAMEKNLVKNSEDFYENKHKNSDLISINFMDIPIEEAHWMLFEANKELIANYYKKQANRVIRNAHRLYLNGKTDFRGFRPV